MEAFVEARNNSPAAEDVLKKPGGGSGGCSHMVALTTIQIQTIKERMIRSWRKD
jgi:hypothetical protein